MSETDACVAVPLADLTALRDSRIKTKRGTGFSHAAVERVIAAIPEPAWEATDEMASAMWEKYRHIDGIATTMSVDEKRRQRLILAAARSVLIAADDSGSSRDSETK